MKTRGFALLSLVASLLLSANIAVGAQGKSSGQIVDGAMAPTETLGPKGRSQPAQEADPEPRMVRVPGMTRFRSVGTNDAVFYDAPSDKAKRLYQAPAGMPVEILSVLQAWVKVRDMQGDVAWVHRDDLADRRTVIATTTVSLYKEPYQTASRWFEAVRGVVFDLQDERTSADDGFVRVHHADGQTGFLAVDQIWGL